MCTSSVTFSIVMRSSAICGCEAASSAKPVENWLKPISANRQRLFLIPTLMVFFLDNKSDGSLYPDCLGKSFLKERRIKQCFNSVHSVFRLIHHNRAIRTKYRSEERRVGKEE